MNLAEVAIADPREDGEDGGQTESSTARNGAAPTVPEDPRFVAINEYFAANPEMVLGTHAPAPRHLRAWPDLHLPRPGDRGPSGSPARHRPVPAARLHPHPVGNFQHGRG